MSEILLMVCNENLQLETIRVPYPVEVIEGEHLNRIKCENGTEYFFTKDGYYDGWGRDMKGIKDEKLEILPR